MSLWQPRGLLFLHGIPFPTVCRTCILRDMKHLFPWKQNEFHPNKDSISQKPLSFESGFLALFLMNSKDSFIRSSREKSLKSLRNPAAQTRAPQSDTYKTSAFSSPSAQSIRIVLPCITSPDRILRAARVSTCF